MCRKGDEAGKIPGRGSTGEGLRQGTKGEPMRLAWRRSGKRRPKSLEVGRVLSYGTWGQRLEFHLYPQSTGELLKGDNCI